MPRGNQDDPPSPAIPFPSVDTIPPSNQNAPSQKIVILPVKRRIECCVETRMIPPPPMYTIPPSNQNAPS